MIYEESPLSIPDNTVLKCTRYCFRTLSVIYFANFVRVKWNDSGFGNECSLSSLKKL
jgi:hypothetical protein